MLLIILFFTGMGIALGFKYIIKQVKSLVKDFDPRKMVAVLAYYGQGLITSVVVAVMNSIAMKSITPLLEMFRNPLSYFDLQLVVGDFWLGFIGFITWLLTAFTFYASLLRSVIFSVTGQKTLTRYQQMFIVVSGFIFSMLFLYAFGFKMSIYLFIIAPMLLIIKQIAIIFIVLGVLLIILGFDFNKIYLHGRRRLLWIYLLLSGLLVVLALVLVLHTF